MFETSRVQNSSKAFQRLPIIGEPSDKQGDKRKNACKALLNSQISFPRLESKKNVSLINIKKPQEDPVSNAAALSESLKCAQNIEQLTAEKDFENCSNVFGLSECKLLFKVPSSEISNNEFETEKEELEESNALKRWEFWTKDRIRLQDYFSKHLENSPCDLQLNKSDKFRQMVEDKMLFEYSKIPSVDKWRGHPYHWKPPLCLNKKKSSNCDHEDSPRYCSVRTKLCEGEVPEMEFIGVPKAIQKEKGLVCKSGKSPKKERERTSCQKEKFVHFMKQKKRLKPRDIQIDELAVVGIKIPQKQDETDEPDLSKNVPEICITSDDEGQKGGLDYRPSIFCLVIQGEEIKYEIGVDDCQDPDKPFNWQIDFGVNTVGSLVEKVLRVENRGTIAVRYDWLSKKIERKLPLDLLIMKQREPWFFFDKNSGFFLPGQIYFLKFYCHAKFSGIRKETWHIKTEPPLSQKQEMGTIFLSVMATEELSNEREALMSYLEKRVRDSAVNFVIQILLHNVFSSTEGLRDIEYRSLFCEKDLFESHNSKYYYHSEIVRALKDLLQEIPSKNQTDWDFSLNTLVELVKTHKGGKEKNSLCFKIAEKAQKLLRPRYVSVKNIKKYKMTFQILCCVMNFAEEDYDYIRNLASQKIEEQPREISFSDVEAEEIWSNRSSESEEVRGPENIKVTNDVQVMFYLKMYKRICEAVEQIAGVLETHKLFQPRRQFDYKLKKPSQTNNSPVQPKA